MIKTLEPNPFPFRLEKRLRRHIIAKRHRFFATTVPGLENVTVQQIASLSKTIQGIVPEKGGVSFDGRMIDLYRANLYLSCAGRILWRLAEFKAANFRQLNKKAGEFAWELYLPTGVVPRCRVIAHRSRLYHTQAIEEYISTVIGDYWRKRRITATVSHTQTLFIRLERDRLTISLDASGANLYLRGIKTHAADAPLRETLAAGLLALAGYRSDRPLIDPMCGAGTFSLEAALIAKRRAPGLHRSYAFLEWPSFREQQWRYLKTRAEEAQAVLESPCIWASDIDPQTVENLRSCVARSALSDAVKVERRDFFALDPREVGGKHESGLVVLNPPYGRRLIPDEEIHTFYISISKRLRQYYYGWRLALIVPEREIGQLFRFALEARNIEHGGLKTVFLYGRIG